MKIEVRKMTEDERIKLEAKFIRKGYAAAQKELGVHLSWIERGDIQYRDDAIDIIEEYGLDTGSLENALEKGANVVIDGRIPLCMEGNMDAGNYAKHIAEEYGLDYRFDEIDKSIKAGANVVLDKVLGHIKKGEIALQLRAGRIIEEHGLDDRRTDLDNAVEIAKMPTWKRYLSSMIDRMA